MIDINIKIDEREVARDIIKEIKLMIRRAISGIESTLNREIKNIVLRRLTTGVPTISGRELQEIGVPDINNRLMSIVRVASENVFVKVYQDNSALLKIELGILEGSYQDVLSLPEAVFSYSSSKGSGVLQWLRWLLLEGNNQIIRDYSYNPAFSNYSRTQGGLMVSGGSWSVPSSLAGTQNDNILTRALFGIDVDIEQLIERELKRNIK